MMKNKPNCKVLIVKRLVRNLKNRLIYLDFS